MATAYIKKGLIRLQWFSLWNSCLIIASLYANVDRESFTDATERFCKGTTARSRSVYVGYFGCGREFSHRVDWFWNLIDLAYLTIMSKHCCFC